MITAFNVLSWSFGAFALYWQKIALYGFVFAFNCSLGVTIFIFHTLSNEKVHEIRFVAQTKKQNLSFLSGSKLFET